MNKSLRVAVLIAGACLAWTPLVHADVVTDWNATTLRCVQGAGPAIPANRTGPAGLLDIALVQAAVHDAVQAIEGRYEPYHYKNASLRGAGSLDAAAAAAAYGVLAGLYGADDPCLSGIANPASTYPGDLGLQAGNEAAAALLPLYRPAFTSEIDPFFGGDSPGEWRPTPGNTRGANAFMAYTVPFTLNRTRQFRPQPPPPMTSEVYRREYDEVRTLGSLTNSARTPEQTDLALFWTANPNSIWYGVLRTIAEAHISSVGDTARVFALASFAAADGQMTVYDSKYHFNFWRPITAIREGNNDGNPGTVGDPMWTPFVVTPPYPDYSSGANSLAASILTTLQLFFGTDDFDFAVLSTVEGLTTNPRPYQRFSDAMQDIVEVRILQGIHFRSADDEGRRQGARVARWAFMKFLRPVPGSH
ncbi:MAG: vanadium-dependent haloperoxidase [Acidobacteria bacterium]|nr:vanadium-dependent haloperoxidase [Acidobacteriota bacterium]